MNTRAALGVGAAIIGVLTLIGLSADDSPTEPTAAPSTFVVEEETTTTEAPTTTVEEETTTTVEAPTTTEPPAPSPDLREDAYLMALAQWTADKPLNMVDLASEDELVEVGRLVCEFFDVGGTVAELSELMVAEFGSDEANLEASAAIAAAAVIHLCPEHEGRVEAELEANLEGSHA